MANVAAAQGRRELHPHPRPLSRHRRRDGEGTTAMDTRMNTRGQG